MEPEELHKLYLRMLRYMTSALEQESKNGKFARWIRVDIAVLQATINEAIGDPCPDTSKLIGEGDASSSDGLRTELHAKVAHLQKQNADAIAEKLHMTGILGGKRY